MYIYYHQIYLHSSLSNSSPNSICFFVFNSSLPIFSIFTCTQPHPGTQIESYPNADKTNFEGPNHLQGLPYLKLTKVKTPKQTLPGLYQHV